MTAIALRRADASDCARIWEWRNAPDVRAVSFTTAEIPWERHREWYSGKLTSPDCLLYIALVEPARPVGMVRFDLDGAEANISVILAPDLRGRGMGTRLIRTATESLFDSTAAGVVHAFIRPDNLASLRAFARAGYERLNATELHGQPAEHFALQRSPERVR